MVYMYHELLDMLPKRAAVLVVGNPRGEKAIFTNQFIADGIEKNEGIIYFVSNTFPEDVAERIVYAVGSNAKNLRIIDCYTLHSGISKQDENGVLRVSGPYALNEISIALLKLLKELRSPVRVIFDSLSTLLLHNKISEIEDFLGLNIRKLKTANATTLLLLEEGVHDTKEIALMESMTDATIRFNSESREISFRKLGYEKKIKYRVENDMIKLEA